MQEKLNAIDVHHHIVPKEYNKIISKLGFGNEMVGHGEPMPDWEMNKPLELMDQLARQCNGSFATLITHYPKKFGGFASLQLPDVDAAIKELDYAFDVLKLDGVVLMSNYDGYYLGDPRFDSLLSELNRRKAVVYIHPTTPPNCDIMHAGFPPFLIDVCFDTTRTAYSLVLSGATEKYPDIRFILSHGGGATPYMASRVENFSLAIPEF